MALYLVTGGAGFIGSNIVGELIRRGEEVRVLDNFSAGRRENLAPWKVEVIEGDVRDLMVVHKATRGAEYVIHEAALRSVPKSIEDPLSFSEVNLRGTLNVLIAAREAKVRRVVFASSSSIYGEREELPEREDDIPKPISPYAATKLIGEYYCRVFTQSFGLETISLRYFNVFGPRQSLETEYAVVIPRFITSMLRDEAPPIHGDGMQSRDFTYIDNVVDATLLAAESKDGSGEVFNIASGKAYTVLELLEALRRIIGKRVEPKFTPPRPGDVRHTLADISKARKLLGFKVKAGFEKGLEKTVRWFSARG